MLGFTVPLFVALGAESLVGLMLLGPRALVGVQLGGCSPKAISRVLGLLLMSLQG